MNEEGLNEEWLRLGRFPQTEAMARSQFVSDLIGGWSDSEFSVGPCDASLSFHADGKLEALHTWGLAGECYVLRWRRVAPGQLEIANMDDGPWFPLTYTILFNPEGNPRFPELGPVTSVSFECDHPDLESFTSQSIPFSGDFGS